MAKVLVTDSKITAVADAIREKLSTTDTYKLDDMPAAIESITYDNIWDLLVAPPPPPPPEPVAYNHKIHYASNSNPNNEYVDFDIEVGVSDPFDSTTSLTTWLFENGYTSKENALTLKNGLYYLYGGPYRVNIIFATLSGSNLYLCVYDSAQFDKSLPSRFGGFTDTVTPIYN